MTATVNGR